MSSCPSSARMLKGPPFSFGTSTIERNMTSRSSPWNCAESPQAHDHGYSFRVACSGGATYLHTRPDQRLALKSRQRLHFRTLVVVMQRPIMMLQRQLLLR